MNRLKSAALAALLLAVAPLARALNLVSIETDYNQNTVSITTVGVTSFTLDVGGFGTAGYAVLGSSYITNGTDGTTAGATVLITTNTKNVVGFSYSFLPQGAAGTLQYSQTVKFPAPKGTGALNGNGGSVSPQNTPYPSANFFTAPVISTSTLIVVPSLTPWSDSFWAKTTNPIFYATSLTASATYTLTVSFGIPERQ